MIINTDIELSVPFTKEEEDAIKQLADNEGITIEALINRSLTKILVKEACIPEESIKHIYVTVTES